MICTICAICAAWLCSFMAHIMHLILFGILLRTMITMLIMGFSSTVSKGRRGIKTPSSISIPAGWRS